jgi:hypothetical protein
MTPAEAIAAAIERGISDAYEKVLRGDLGDFAAGGLFAAGGDVFGFGAAGQRRSAGPEVLAEGWRTPARVPFLQKAYLHVSEAPSVAIAAAQLREDRESQAAAEKLRRRVQRALESLAATGEAS